MAKIRLKQSAPVPAGAKGKGKGKKVGDLMDLFVSDFAQTMGRIGDLAAASKPEWNVTRVSLWEGYSVEAALPVRSLIDADAMEVMARTVTVAGRARSDARKHLNSSEGSLHKGTLRANMGLDRYSLVSDRDFLQYAVRQVMRAQGWNEVVRHKFWLSPSWLFPQIRLPFAELEAMILEEVDNHLGYEVGATVDSLALGLAVEDLQDDLTTKIAEKKQVEAKASHELSDVDTGVLDHEPAPASVKSIAPDLDFDLDL